MTFEAIGNELNMGERAIRKVYVRMTRIVNHSGGIIMVWWWFTLNGVKSLHRVEGIMDQDKYHEIIKK